MGNIKPHTRPCKWLAIAAICILAVLAVSVASYAMSKPHYIAPKLDYTRPEK